MKFELRTGPRQVDTGVDYPDLTPPEWFRDAKLGVFIHWGLYSIPAYAELPPDDGHIPVEEAYERHQYAEWYANTVRLPASGAYAFHQERFGVGTTYEDLAAQWETPRFDPAEWLDVIGSIGARYAILASKHHDGYCLWDTATTSFNAARRRPGRDLVAEISAGVRAAGLRFGLYFSGALDWHVTDLPPANSDADVFRLRRSDRAFAAYAATQMRELVDRFEPDIFWNDLDWPDAGKLPGPNSVATLLGEYLARCPDGAVNDRWGVPAHGYLTREYLHVPEVLERPWECCRGLGRSFGINERERPEHQLSGAELVRLLCDVVGKNGNLLINIGPRADGSLPPEYAKTFSEVGRWLQVNGEAIFGTRPWFPAGHRPPADLAVTTDGRQVYVCALAPEKGIVTLPAGLDAAEARWLGADRAASVGPDVEIPAGLRHEPGAVLAVGGRPSGSGAGPRQRERESGLLGGQQRGAEQPC